MKWSSQEKKSKKEERKQTYSLSSIMNNLYPNVLFKIGFHHVNWMGWISLLLSPHDRNLIKCISSFLHVFQISYSNSHNVWRNFRLFCFEQNSKKIMGFPEKIFDFVFLSSNIWIFIRKFFFESMGLKRFWVCHACLIGLIV